MKALKVISSCLLLFIQVDIFAQDTIYVSYNKVTAIQFPSPIISPVTASKHLVAHIEDENLLSVKVASKGFIESSLIVNTADGMSYEFPVSFSYGRAGRINRVAASKMEEASKSEIPSLNNTISQEIAEARSRRTVSRDKSSKVKSELGNITISGDRIFYRLELKNRSNINFDIDFTRFYLRDIKTAKRTVTQEQEIYPIYSYRTEHETVLGKSSEVYVFALNKFPITKGKALFIEVYEKNGGRHQYLKARQSDIERARLFNLK